MNLRGNLDPLITSCDNLSMLFRNKTATPPVDARIDLSINTRDSGTSEGKIAEILLEAAFSEPGAELARGLGHEALRLTHKLS